MVSGSRRSEQIQLVAFALQPGKILIGNRQVSPLFPDMSSAAPTKRDIAPNTAPSGKSLIACLKPCFTTSARMKATTAVTGALLTGFLVVHLLGNLQILAGPDAINNYAHKLKELGPFLWLARGGLLTIFLVH